jgi:tRNA/rRNA methyltransferase
MPPPPTPPIEQPRFVLVGTSHAGNVGAAARAMKVMGFDDLVLVAPRDPEVLRRDETLARASGAADVLARARVVATLGEALDGVTYACATAMTARDFGPPHHAPRPLFAALAPAGHRVGFVFGAERHGLANADVYACHACLVIPTEPAYGSLNLAAAVQLVAYDWRQAVGGFPLVGGPAPAARADAPAVRGLLAHWQGALESLGFLDPARPRKLMARLHRLAHRAELTEEEVHILRGIARAAEEAAATAKERSR